MNINNKKNINTTKFDLLKNEMLYKCDGSCTCKFLQDRSNYDTMQIKSQMSLGQTPNLPIYKQNSGINGNINSNTSKGWY